MFENLFVIEYFINYITTTAMRYSTIFITLITLLIITFQASIPLTKTSMQKQSTKSSPTNFNCILQANVGNLQLDFRVSLSNQYSSWVKAQNCQLCTTQDVCQENCFGNQNQFGVRCSKPYCKQVDSSENIVPSGGPVIQGTNSIVKLKLKDNDKKKVQQDFPLLLAAKMNKKVQEDGQLNLLGEGLVIPQFYLFKDKKNGLSIYIQKSKDKTFSLEFIGNQIHVQDDELSDINKLQVSQVSIQYIDQSIKNIENQVKLPLSRHFIQFSLQTSYFYLPTKILNQIGQQVAKLLINYQCNFTISNYTLSCQKKMSLSTLDKFQIIFILNGVQVGFPLMLLIDSCSQNICKTILRKSHDKKLIILGDRIFDVFALHYKLDDHQLYKLDLLRTNNTLNQQYKSVKKWKTKQIGYTWTVIYLTLYIFWYIFKFLFYAAIFSLILSCIYKREDFIRWWCRIFKKLQKRRQKRLQQHSMSQIDGEIIPVLSSEQAIQ